MKDFINKYSYEITIEELNNDNGNLNVVPPKTPYPEASINPHFKQKGIQVTLGSSDDPPAPGGFQTVTKEDKSYWGEMVLPKNKGIFNRGLTCPSSSWMLKHLGYPLAGPATDRCQGLAGSFGEHQVTKDFGPFKATGFSLAVESLQTILNEIYNEEKSLFAALGSAGMQCGRLTRGSSHALSAHSWGMAIDLKINGKLTPWGSIKIQRGHERMIPIFNKHGWVNGYNFRIPDAMHYQPSIELIEQWMKEGKLKIDDNIKHDPDKPISSTYVSKAISSTEQAPPAPPAQSPVTSNKVRIDEKFLLSHTIIKDYNTHINTHFVVFENIPEPILNTLQKPNTLLHLKLFKYTDYKMGAKALVSKQVFRIKKIKIINQTRDRNYTVQIFMMAAIVDDILTRKFYSQILSQATAKNLLNSIVTKTNDRYGTDLQVYTNGASPDADVTFNDVYKLNPYHTDFVYEQILIPNINILSQLSMAINDAYKLFYTTAFWHLDDFYFSKKGVDRDLPQTPDHLLYLMILEPRHIEIMVNRAFKSPDIKVNSMVTDISKWWDVIDKNKLRLLLNSNLVFTKPDGQTFESPRNSPTFNYIRGDAGDDVTVYVNDGISEHTLNISLKDSLAEFEKRLKALKDLADYNPQIAQVKFTDYAIEDIKQLIAYDFVEDLKFDCMVLDQQVTLKRHLDNDSYKLRPYFVSNAEMVFYRIDIF